MQNHSALLGELVTFKFKGAWSMPVSLVHGSIYKSLIEVVYSHWFTSQSNEDNGRVILHNTYPLCGLYWKTHSNISRVLHKINIIILLILQIYCRPILMFHIPSAYVIPLGPGSINLSLTSFDIYGPEHVTGILSNIDSFKRQRVPESCKKKKKKILGLLHWSSSFYLQE